MNNLLNIKMSNSALNPTNAVEAVDQLGKVVNVNIASEHPLTIKLNDEEIVTLMTIGTNPEELVLGYLHNQRLIENISDIDQIMVDWTKELADVKTKDISKPLDLKTKLSKRIVTTGCGQGTLFSCSLDKLYEIKLSKIKVKQSQIYLLLKSLSKQNGIYKKAGAVHGCALCQKDQSLIFIEDVGRHNATDAISGRMLINGISGEDKILYTTGRLTSEIVIKAALMGISVLLSRSGITHMGLEIAQDLNLTMIARAKNKRFLVYNGHENIEFDDSISN